MSHAKFSPNPPHSMRKRWEMAFASMRGTPDRYNSATSKLISNSFAGLTLPELVISNPSRSQRITLMANSTPRYIPDPKKFSHQLDCNCPLCKEICQGLRSKGQIKLPIIKILSTRVISIPNLFPAQKFHSLAVMRNHDDLSLRVLPQGTLPDTIIPHIPGRRRAQLLNSNDLVTIFKESIRLGFIALHNHPLSGMSIPLHDHWHLHPVDETMAEYFAQLVTARMLRSHKRFQRVSKAASDIILIKNTKGIDELAERTARVFNILESQGKVTTLLFNPEGQYVLVSILDPSVPQIERSGLGSTVFFNKVSSSQLSGGPKAPAPRNSVPWSELTGGQIPL